MPVGFPESVVSQVPACRGGRGPLVGFGLMDCASPIILGRKNNIIDRFDGSDQDSFRSLTPVGNEVVRVGGVRFDLPPLGDGVFVLGGHQSHAFLCDPLQGGWER